MTPERERVAIEAMQPALAPMIDLLISKMAMIVTRELGGLRGVEESYALDDIVVNAVIDKLKRYYVNQKVNCNA